VTAHLSPISLRESGKILLHIGGRERVGGPPSIGRAQHNPAGPRPHARRRRYTGSFDETGNKEAAGPDRPVLRVIDEGRDGRHRNVRGREGGGW